MIKPILLFIIFFLKAQNFIWAVEEEGEKESTLFLKCRNVSDFNTVTLLKMPQHQSLRYLDLSSNQIGDETIDMATQHLPDLKFLKIADTLCTQRSINMITERLPQITTLNVSHITFDKATAKEIGTRLLHLKTLKAENCNLTSTICKHLTESLKDLQSLSLAFNHFNVKGFYGLTLKKHHDISRLNLKFNYIYGLDVLKLTQSPWFSNIEILNLSRNNIGDFALRYICRELKKLTVLKLCTCFLQDHHAILISDNLFNLRILKLASNQIGDEGATSLITAPINNLKILDLILNPIHQPGIEALIKHQKDNFGKIHIYWSPDPLEELKPLESLGTVFE